MYNITCHQLNNDREYKVNKVIDIIIRENFIMIEFNLKKSTDMDNIITFFSIDKYLFNITYPNSEKTIISFIGRYNKFIKIEKQTYLIFRKEVIWNL